MESVEIFSAWLTGVAVGYAVGALVTFYFSQAEKQRRLERKHEKEFTERLNKAAAAMQKDPEWINTMRAFEEDCVKVQLQSPLERAVQDAKGEM